MSVVDIGDGDKFLDYIRSLKPPERDDLFLKSVRRGDVARAEQFLEGGADINSTNSAALAIAAAAGAPGLTARPMIDLLVRKGIILGSNLDAALLAAAAGGDEPAAARLLDLGANPARDDSSPLFAAVVNNHAGTAGLLLDRGAEALANKGALLGIALSRKFTAVAEALLRHGADPGLAFKGMNAYEWCAETGQAGFLTLLRDWKPAEEAYLSAGYFRLLTPAQLRQEDSQGRTGFTRAAMAGCFDIACEKILASPGDTLRADDLLHQSRDGQSALFALGERGRLSQAFNAGLWAGRKQEALLIIERSVPDAFRPQIDAPAFAAALDRLALKAQARKLPLKSRAP